MLKQLAGPPLCTFYFWVDAQWVSKQTEDGRKRFEQRCIKSPGDKTPASQLKFMYDDGLDASLMLAESIDDEVYEYLADYQGYWGVEGNPVRRIEWISKSTRADERARDEAKARHKARIKRALKVLDAIEAAFAEADAGVREKAELDALVAQLKPDTASGPNWEDLF